MTFTHTILIPPKQIKHNNTRCSTQTYCKRERGMAVYKDRNEGITIFNEKVSKGVKKSKILHASSERNIYWCRGRYRPGQQTHNRRQPKATRCKQTQMSEAIDNLNTDRHFRVASRFCTVGLPKSSKNCSRRFRGDRVFCFRRHRLILVGCARSMRYSSNHVPQLDLRLRSTIRFFLNPHPRVSNIISPGKLFNHTPGWLSHEPIRDLHFEFQGGEHGGCSYVVRFFGLRCCHTIQKTFCKAMNNSSGCCWGRLQSLGCVLGPCACGRDKKADHPDHQRPLLRRVLQPRVPRVDVCARQPS